MPIPNIEIICSEVAPLPPMSLPTVQLATESVLSDEPADAVEVTTTITFESAEVSSFQFDLFAQNCNSDISILSFTVEESPEDGSEFQEK